MIARIEIERIEFSNCVPGVCQTSITGGIVPPSTNVKVCRWQNRAGYHHEQKARGIAHQKLQWIAYSRSIADMFDVVSGAPQRA
jgi:hypothetical protein